MINSGRLALAILSPKLALLAVLFAVSASNWAGLELNNTPVGIQKTAECPVCLLI